MATQFTALKNKQRLAAVRKTFKDSAMGKSISPRRIETAAAFCEEYLEEYVARRRRQRSSGRGGKAAPKR